MRDPPYDDPRSDSDTAGITTKTTILEASLVGLPHDLVQNLYRYLSISDRLKLARVCKSLHYIYTTSKILQYEFTLQTNGYLDIPSSVDYNPDGSPSYVPYNEVNPQWQLGLPPPKPGQPPSGPTRAPIGPLPPFRPIPSVTIARPDRTETLSLSSAVGRRVFGPSSSPYDKTLLLRAQETAWETLTPRVQKEIQITGPEGVYELQEGVFLMCDDYSRSLGRKPTSIRLIPLPSTHDTDLDDTALPIKSHKLKFAIADLTMDPTQDLIVVSEDRTRVQGHMSDSPTHRYHLLTLSDFSPHPLADMGFIEFPPAAQAETHTRQLLQVMGDTLVVLVSRYQFNWIFMALAGVVQPGMNGMPNMSCEEEMVCWNWRTGKVLARMQLPENGWFASLALLTPTTFMVTSTSNISPIMGEPTAPTSAFPPVISIYSFLPDPVRPVNPAQPLGSVYTDDTTPRPILIAQLELPRLAQGVNITEFEVRPDPAFPVGKTPGVGQRKPYTQDPEKGILVFQLKVTEPPNPELDRAGPSRKVGYELFILRETLVKLAQEGEERIREQRGEREGNAGEYAFWRVEKTYPWSEWGEKGSRFMDISMKKRAWVCSCSGYRFVDLVSKRDFNLSQRFRESDLANPTQGKMPADEEAVEREINGFDDAPARETGSAIGDGDVEMDQTNMEDVNGEHEELDLDDDGDDDEDDTFRPLRLCHIRVLDFSPIRLKRPLSRDPRMALVTTRQLPTVLSKRRVWQEDVVTTLPYTEVVQVEPIVANGVMIDDQRIIAIKTFERPDGERLGDRQELTVYCM